MISRLSGFADHTRALLSRGAFALLLGVVLHTGLSTNAQAQPVSAINGRSIYISPLVSGQRTCSDGTCHGNDPALNLNRIKNGANNPTLIANATQTNPDMVFLRDVLTSSQLSDLAAYILTASTGNQGAVTLSSSTLTFATTNLGTTSALQIVTLTNTGVAPLQLSAISVNNSEFAVAIGTCANTTLLPIGSSCSLGLSFTPKLVGTRTGTLSVNHNGPNGATNIPLTGIGALAASGTTISMIEFYFTALDYYFITSRASEIALLDASSAWRRTGKSFNVYTSQQTGAAGISRYYFDQVAVNNTRGSHFYTLVQGEREALAALNPGNSRTPRLPFNEGIDSYAFAPLVEGVGGRCAAGQIPVYRLFRNGNRFPDNPNHRFTTDTAIYNSFIAQGWDGEGVKFCAPG
jgi:Repeat of unknown function (DUF5648)